VFAIVPPGAMMHGRIPPGAAAAQPPPASDGSYTGAMLSYLGGLGASLASSSSYIGTLVGPTPPPKTAAARLDDFLGGGGGGGGAYPQQQQQQQQQAERHSAGAMGAFLGEEAQRGPAPAAAPPRRSRNRHVDMRQHDWDSDDDSDDGGGGGGGGGSARGGGALPTLVRKAGALAEPRARTCADASRARSQAIPSMRPAAATGKALVLGQPQVRVCKLRVSNTAALIAPALPQSPASRDSTPQSGGTLRVGAFGPPPGALAPATASLQRGAPRESAPQREARSSGRSGGGSPLPRRSAVAVGGSRPGTHTDGTPREWDESSSDDD
jgi:hypothetical protein